MSADTARKQPRPVDTGRLLRPQNRLDLIFDLDVVTGQADVRGSMILDVTPQYVVAAQTDPPILKSATDKVVEATIVHHDLITYEATRWGWTSQIIGLSNTYQLNPQDPEAPRVAVIFLSLPPAGGIQKSNVRQAYRIDVSSNDNIEIKIVPEMGKVRLLNFSAGGFMLGTPAPSHFRLGQILNYRLVFPGDEQSSGSVIEGEAAVVRLEYEPGQKETKLGLKFQDVDINSSRSLQRLINRYMLEEQRKRNRDF